MLGKYVKVKVTSQIGSRNNILNFDYELNYGQIENLKHNSANVCGVYIMGVSKPINVFEGKIIAIIKRKNTNNIFYVAAPKNVKFIESEIRTAIDFAEKHFDYNIDCLFEKSCGAVVYRLINNEYRFLLIKNKRSAHWGFPKGHVENDETPKETAIREVFEEAGIRITLIPDFETQSDYTIQGKVEKNVTIFLAETKDTRTIIQKTEIEDYMWQNYEKCMSVLKFENDKKILSAAHDFLIEKGLIKSK